MASKWKLMRRKVYALDRLPNPDPYFAKLQTRATKELGTSLHYRQIDVRDSASLTQIVADIADKHKRLDGLIAAAGIQQETSALDYTVSGRDLILLAPCSCDSIPSCSTHS